MNTPQKITSNHEFVTPAMAAIYLIANVGNRVVKKSNVAYFVKLIKNGEFFTTHQGIAFSEDGRLLDGQHRLLAIIETGIGAWVMVTRGLSDNAFQAIDFGGVRRSYSDITGIPKRAVAVTRFILAKILSEKKGARAFTPDEICDLYSALGKQIDEVLACAKSNAPVMASAPSVAGAALRAYCTGDSYPAESISRMCSAVSQCDISELSPAERCFAQRTIKGRFATKSQDPEAAYHAWIATDPALKNTTIIHQARLDAAMMEMRNVVEQARASLSHKKKVPPHVSAA